MSDDTVKIIEHWCEAEDGRYVRETDPDARFLRLVPGDEISRDEAKRLGILDSEDQQPAVKSAPKPQTKPEPGLKITKPVRPSAAKGDKS